MIVELANAGAATSASRCFTDDVIAARYSEAGSPDGWKDASGFRRCVFLEDDDKLLVLLMEYEILKTEE